MLPFGKYLRVGKPLTPNLELRVLSASASTLAITTSSALAKASPSFSYVGARALQWPHPYNTSNNPSILMFLDERHWRQGDITTTTLCSHQRGLVLILANPFNSHSQDLISNSPYFLPHRSYHVSSENLVLDQLKSPWLKFSLFSLLVCLILYW